MSRNRRLGKSAYGKERLFWYAEKFFWIISFLRGTLPDTDTLPYRGFFFKRCKFILQKDSFSNLFLSSIAENNQLRIC